MAAMTSERKNWGDDVDDARCSSFPFLFSSPLTSVSSPTPTSTEPWSDEAMALVGRGESALLSREGELRRSRGVEGAHTNASTFLLSLSLFLFFLSPLSLSEGREMSLSVLCLCFEKREERESRRTGKRTAAAASAAAAAEKESERKRKKRRKEEESEGAKKKTKKKKALFRGRRRLQSSLFFFSFSSPAPPALAPCTETRIASPSPWL